MENTLPTDALPGDLVDTTVAAKRLRVHVATLYRLMQSGKLRYWKRLGRRFLSLADVTALFVPVEAAPPVRVARPWVPSAKETKRILEERGLL